MKRKGIYPIDYVFNILGNHVFDERSSHIIFDGEIIKANSQRYQVFKLRGCKCCNCGLKAQYFALEKVKGDKKYHLNLYGVKGNREILFTKDHIIPKSKGGKDRLENYQTMCVECNMLKANS